MIFMRIFISILMICCPFLTEAHNKVILIIPRHVRRVQNTVSPQPYRQFIRQSFIKSRNHLDNEFLPSQLRPYIQYHYRPKNTSPSSSYNKNLQHHGDNYDQSQIEIKPIIISHGKGISDAMNFGKGYIPHETLMRYLHNHQTDSYYQNDEAESHQNERHEQRADEMALKFMNIKSNDKNENNFNNEKSLVVPRAIPQLSLGNGRTGIILHDSIGTDDYNKQILELTSTWPKPLSSPTAGVLSTGGIRPDIISQFNGVSSTQSLVSHPIDLNDFHGHTQFTSSFTPDNINQHHHHHHHHHQGYAVKEDIEDIPHDFRVTPIQSTPQQTSNIQQQLPPVAIQSSQNNNAFGNHQPFVPSVQTQTQSVPGYYALAGFAGITNT